MNMTRLLALAVLLALLISTTACGTIHSPAEISQLETHELIDEWNHYTYWGWPGSSLVLATQNSSGVDRATWTRSMRAAAVHRLAGAYRWTPEECALVNQGQVQAGISITAAHWVLGKAKRRDWSDGPQGRWEHWRYDGPPQITYTFHDNALVWWSSYSDR